MTPYYKEKLEQGLTYQDFVIDELYRHGLPIISYSSKKYQMEVGENKPGFEIKNDQKFHKTGNLYIEIAEKSSPQISTWTASGIFRNDNTWLYIIGDYQRIFVFGKSQLIQASLRSKFLKVWNETSRGFLLPVEVAERIYSIKIIECLKK